MTFADRLKETMAIRNLTATKLAELAGLDPSHISHFVNGRREPSLATFRKIVHVLRIDAAWLLGE